LIATGQNGPASEDGDLGKKAFESIMIGSAQIAFGCGPYCPEKLVFHLEKLHRLTMAMNLLKISTKYNQRPWSS
jgi:hypothetical protein